MKANESMLKTCEKYEMSGDFFGSMGRYSAHSRVASKKGRPSCGSF